MRIALVQPDLSEHYRSQQQAYESADQPPETGLAVLSSWINAYSEGNNEVVVLDPRKSVNELAQEAAAFDILGMTSWFSNHETAIFIAKLVKAINPSVKVILGGPNASLVARETLSNHQAIDMIIARDGEDAFLGIVDDKPIHTIPNLWYRGVNGNALFTFEDFTPLKDMPIWDYDNFQAIQARLAPYLEAQAQNLDQWQTPVLTLFSFRGCVKAMRDGVCTYCTSSETRGRALPAELLWQQIVHLNTVYGAERFYMADDIFTVSPKRIADIAGSKPKEAQAQIRAYGYLPDLAKLEQPVLQQMARELNTIGVNYLFYGSETFDRGVLERVNKDGTSVGETLRILRTLKDYGDVQSTVAFILGLPGESLDSLQANVRAFEKLLEAEDCIGRLYISGGMPLKGTPWCDELIADAQTCESYSRLTGKNLQEDDNPDYELLARLSLEHSTSVTQNQVNETIQKIIDLALTKIPPHRVGGFMLQADP